MKVGLLAVFLHIGCLLAMKHAKPDGVFDVDVGFCRDGGTFATCKFMRAKKYNGPQNSFYDRLQLPIGVVAYYKCTIDVDGNRKVSSFNDEGYEYQKEKVNRYLESQIDLFNKNK